MSLISVVILHAVAAIFLAKTAGGASSLNNAIFYALIGLFVVFALFKLKYLLGSLRRKVKRSAREISHGVSSTSGVPQEQRREPLP